MPLDKNDEFYLSRLMWEDGVFAVQVAPDFEFLEGKRYLRMDGKLVTIIKGRRGAKGYETVQADDGADSPGYGKPHEFIGAEGKTITHYSSAEELGNRYNRSTSQEGLGRLTGSSWDNPRNLIPIYFPALNGE